MKLDNWLSQHHEPPDGDDWEEPDHYQDLIDACEEIRSQMARLRQGISFADNDTCVAAENGLRVACEQILEIIGD
jgi:hypothetical protein